ncbi:hypothetical protein ACVIRM_003773 [Rhizobium laguerreae]
MGNLIGHHRAAAAGMLGPAEHAGLIEGAVEDELVSALEQVEQADLALRPFERIGLLHRHPRHAPALGGQRIAGTRLSLLLDEQLRAGRLPGLRRHDRWLVHGLSAFSILG